MLERPAEPLSIAFLALSAVMAAGALLLFLPLPLPRAMRLPLYLLLHIGGLAAGTALFLAGRRYSQWAPQKQ
jgi:hypothetical protein